MELQYPSNYITHEQQEAIKNLRATDMESFIELELYQDTAHTSGQQLYGTVHLFAKENIRNVK